MYAIIETGGKQYKVENGDVISCEKLNVEEGKKVTFDKVLVVGDDNGIKVGTPYIDGETVEGKVIENGKGKKVIVFKYKAKKDSKSKQGHRQPFTKVEITKLGGKAAKPAAKATAKAEEKPAKAPAKAKKAEEAPAAKAEKVSASMKKDELIAYAEKNGIKVDKKAKKADIIEAINNAK